VQKEAAPVGLLSIKTPKTHLYFNQHSVLHLDIFVFPLLALPVYVGMPITTTGLEPSRKWPEEERENVCLSQIHSHSYNKQRKKSWDR